MKHAAVIALLIAVSAPALALAASAVHAESLTLGCSGTATTVDVPKNNVASDPQKENITDFSVIVDFDKRTVAGLWTDLNGIHPPFPITAIDANSVTFNGSAKLGGRDSVSVTGTVDRITGHVDATQFVQYSNESTSTVTFDLRCKPTKPLF